MKKVCICGREYEDGTQCQHGMSDEQFADHVETSNHTSSPGFTRPPLMFLVKVEGA